MAWLSTGDFQRDIGEWRRIAEEVRDQLEVCVAFSEKESRKFEVFERLYYLAKNVERGISQAHDVYYNNQAKIKDLEIRIKFLEHANKTSNNKS